MKRLFSLLLIFATISTLTSCKITIDKGDDNSDDNTEEQYEITGDVFRLSSIVDITDTSGVASYAVCAPYTDTYEIKCTKSSKLVIYDSERIIKSGTTELNVELKKDVVYGLRIETDGEEKSFKIHTKALNHEITLPYDVADVADVSNISLESSDADPLESAVIDYKKRDGGTYIYSNNPELVPSDSVGDAFIRNTDLTGEVFFTFEHANYSSSPFYLGYQLKNEGDKDVYITVTNVGYQAGGTWFGQMSWFDYYNTSFTLPEIYRTNPDRYSNFDYAYQNYSPKIFQPTTYRLPAGEYIYVIGGTSEDAYSNINVNNTADKLLDPNKCANGNVKFIVSGGSVTGTFYCYNDIAQVKAEPNQRGYRTGNYYAQYSGIAYHQGVIDNYASWTFNDFTEPGDLPVSYTNVYADNLPQVAIPYQEYNNSEHQVNNVYSWITHLNPQNEHKAVGMDIVDFEWVNSFGEPVKIDNLHADGGGRPANTANWMIEYQEHYTFINQGDEERKITLYLKDGGTLAIMLRDSNTGEVLSTYYTMGQASLYYAQDIYVPPHAAIQVTLQYVLVACSYGNVTHWLSIE